MTNCTRNGVLSIQESLKGLQRRGRLVSVIAKLSREIELLEEDNQQLRAAVSIYRELADSRGSQNLPVAACRPN